MTSDILFRYNSYPMVASSRHHDIDNLFATNGQRDAGHVTLPTSFRIPPHSERSCFAVRSMFPTRSVYIRFLVCCTFSFLTESIPAAVSTEDTRSKICPQPVLPSAQLHSEAARTKQYARRRFLSRRGYPRDVISLSSS